MSLLSLSHACPETRADSCPSAEPVKLAHHICFAGPVAVLSAESLPVRDLRFTLPQTNMEPEKEPFQEDSSLIPLSGSMYVWQGVKHKPRDLCLV